MNAIALHSSVGNVVALPAMVAGEFTSLPVPVRKAIIKLDVAYPAGVANFTQGEVGLRNEVYAEAIVAFPTIVALGALKHLLLHNPRNPFAPSPQDVHELCQKFQKRFVEAITRNMLGAEWAPPQFAANCPAPGAPGHPLQMETVRSLVRRSLDWGLALERYQLGIISTDEFNKIRSEMFDPGEREQFIAKHQSSENARQEGRGPTYFRHRDDVRQFQHMEHQQKVASELELVRAIRRR